MPPTSTKQNYIYIYYKTIIKINKRLLKQKLNVIHFELRVRLNITNKMIKYISLRQKSFKLQWEHCKNRYHLDTPSSISIPLAQSRYS